MICPNCKTNNPDSANFCEMCGAPLMQQNAQNNANTFYAPQQPVMQPQGRMSGKAIAGFVLSLVSWCIFGLVLSILGIVFSALAMKDMKLDSTVRGKGFAVAGLVISIVALAFTVLGFLIMPSMYIDMLEAFL